jgi:hypothetical protein
MPSIEVGRRRAQEARLELLAMGAVVHPFARCRDPLASRNGGGMADDRDQIAVPACLCPENAETVLVIMEGDALYKARQHFLGRWFRLELHLCWRFWRQSHGVSNEPGRIFSRRRFHGTSL